MPKKKKKSYHICNPTAGHISGEEHDPKGYTHPDVRHSTVHNRQDTEAASMSINRGMDREDRVHVHNGYYSAILKDEIMPSVATWMDLDIVRQSDVKSEEEKYPMTSFICGI